MLNDMIAALERAKAATAELNAAVNSLPPHVRAEVVASLVAEFGVAPPPAVSIGETTPGKPPARSPQGTPGVKGVRRASQKLVLALSGGPLRVQEAAERAGCSEAAASQSLRNNIDLFEKVEPANRKSPWRLTESGQSLASSLTTAPAT